jgi:hypothetical protein
MLGLRSPASNGRIPAGLPPHAAGYVQSLLFDILEGDYLRKQEKVNYHL